MPNMQANTIYDDARIYDIVHSNTKDADLYLKLLTRCPCPVLELACGSGRVTIPLAEGGHTVTGIDISEPMLDLAREKAEAKGVQVEWIKSDVTAFDLGRQFGAILIPCNSICHLLDHSSIGACLSKVREHLADNGRFVLQVFNPNFRAFTRDPDIRYPVAEFDDPSGRGRVTVTENNVYNRATQVNQIKWYYTYEETGLELVKNLDMRIFYPQELDALLLYNGFEIEEKYGDYDMSQFQSDSPFQIPVCRKR